MTKLTVIEQWWQQKEREALNGHTCPDCGSDDMTWMPGTYYERGEYSCNECSPGIESMFDDTRYDNQKDNRHANL